MPKIYFVNKGEKNMINQKILPAILNMKEFEKFLISPFEICIILETHLSQLKNISLLSQKYNKKIIYHIDMIHGLKNDNFGTEYLCQEFKPYGIISTKGSAIQKANQKKIVTIQRIFILDSHAIERSIKNIIKSTPDYIEILPSSTYSVFQEIYEKTNIPFFTGGLIRTTVDIENALKNGATAVTTTNPELWNMGV